MEIVEEGDITVKYSCTCPYCEEYQNTDTDENIRRAIYNQSEHWFCEFDNKTDNLIVQCSNSECRKEFLVKKFTHSIY